MVCIHVDEDLRSSFCLQRISQLLFRQLLTRRNVSEPDVKILQIAILITTLLSTDLKPANLIWKKCWFDSEFSPHGLTRLNCGSPSLVESLEIIFMYCFPPGVALFGSFEEIDFAHTEKLKKYVINIDAMAVSPVHAHAYGCITKHSCKILLAFLSLESHGLQFLR